MTPRAYSRLMRRRRMEKFFCQWLGFTRRRAVRWARFIP